VCVTLRSERRERLEGLRSARNVCVTLRSERRERLEGLRSERNVCVILRSERFDFAQHRLRERLEGLRSERSERLEGRVVMKIRPARKDEAATWSTLRMRLWPSADPQELAAEAALFLSGGNIPTISAVFLAEDDATPLGFLELALRAFSDGCDSKPVPHVEGWYVEAFARERGVGRALMHAAEDWARANGFVELASDTEPWNDGSLAAHAHCGFQEVERLVKFRKVL